MMYDYEAYNCVVRPSSKRTVQMNNNIYIYIKNRPRRPQKS